MKVNQQSPEKPTSNEQGFLEVHSTFLTIQGEGPLAGTPAVFIRLAGCNLICDLCDTDYTSTRRFVTVEDIIDDVQQIKAAPWLVVITGGEPFRQAGLVDLVTVLLAENYRVQIETNGTLFLPVMGATIVCSPKTATINNLMWTKIQALKYVVQADHIDPTDGLPTMVLGQPCRVAKPHQIFVGQIYVQPCDEYDEVKNKANLKAAVESCMRFGYRLTTQIHKGADLP